MYERLAEAVAAVHKPLEQWLIDILAAATMASAYPDE
jgi:hypothetical protein